VGAIVLDTPCVCLALFNGLAHCRAKVCAESPGARSLGTAVAILTLLLRNN
jgi:hypothetical protein